MVGSTYLSSGGAIPVLLSPPSRGAARFTSPPAAKWIEGVLMAFRRFLVASSVARLIHGALGGEWRVEGYLNGGDQRRTHVLLEGNNGHLILEEEVQGSRVVEDIIVPRRHAEALLDACLGRLDIDRVALSINRRPAFLDRVTSRDKKVDLLTVEIEDGAPQGTFYPPAWVGREDTDGAL